MGMKSWKVKIIKTVTIESNNFEKNGLINAFEASSSSSSHLILISRQYHQHRLWNK